MLLVPWLGVDCLSPIQGYIVLKMTFSALVPLVCTKMFSLSIRSMHWGPVPFTFWPTLWRFWRRTGSCKPQSWLSQCPVCSRTPGSCAELSSCRIHGEHRCSTVGRCFKSILDTELKSGFPSWCDKVCISNCFSSNYPRWIINLCKVGCTHTHLIVWQHWWTPESRGAVLQ